MRHALTRADCCLLLRCRFLLSNRGRTDCQEHRSPGRDRENEGHQDPPHDGQVRGRRRLHGFGGTGERAPRPGSGDILAAGDDGCAGL